MKLSGSASETIVLRTVRCCESPYVSQPTWRENVRSLGHKDEEIVQIVERWAVSWFLGFAQISRYFSFNWNCL